MNRLLQSRTWQAWISGYRLIGTGDNGDEHSEVWSDGRDRALFESSGEATCVIGVTPVISGVLA